MSKKSLNEKKKPYQCRKKWRKKGRRKKSALFFEKITITSKETLPYQNITMLEIVCNKEE